MSSSRDQQIEKAYSDWNKFYMANGTKYSVGKVPSIEELKDYVDNFTQFSKALNQIGEDVPDEMVAIFKGIVEPVTRPDASSSVEEENEELRELIQAIEECEVLFHHVVAEQQIEEKREDAEIHAELESSRREEQEEALRDAVEDLEDSVDGVEAVDEGASNSAEKEVEVPDYFGADDDDPIAYQMALDQAERDRLEQDRLEQERLEQERVQREAEAEAERKLTIDGLYDQAGAVDEKAGELANVIKELTQDDDEPDAAKMNELAGRYNELAGELEEQRQEFIAKAEAIRAREDFNDNPDLQEAYELAMQSIAGLQATINKLDTQYEEVAENVSKKQHHLTHPVSFTGIDKADMDEYPALKELLETEEFKDKVDKGEVTQADLDDLLHVRGKDARMDKLKAMGLGSVIEGEEWKDKLGDVNKDIKAARKDVDLKGKDDPSVKDQYAELRSEREEIRAQTLAYQKEVSTAVTRADGIDNDTYDRLRVKAKELDARVKRYEASSKALQETETCKHDPVMQQALKRDGFGVQRNNMSIQNASESLRHALQSQDQDQVRERQKEIEERFKAAEQARVAAAKEAEKPKQPEVPENPLPGAGKSSITPGSFTEKRNAERDRRNTEKTRQESIARKFAQMYKKNNPKGNWKKWPGNDSEAEKKQENSFTITAGHDPDNAFLKAGIYELDYSEDKRVHGMLAELKESEDGKSMKASTYGDVKQSAMQESYSQLIDLVVAATGAREINFDFKTTTLRTEYGRKLAMKMIDSLVTAAANKNPPIIVNLGPNANAMMMGILDRCKVGSRKYNRIKKQMEKINRKMVALKESQKIALKGFQSKIDAGKKLDTMRDKRRLSGDDFKKKFDDSGKPIADMTPDESVEALKGAVKEHKERAAALVSEGKALKGEMDQAHDAIEKGELEDVKEFTGADLTVKREGYLDAMQEEERRLVDNKDVLIDEIDKMPSLSDDEKLALKSEVNQAVERVENNNQENGVDYAAMKKQNLDLLEEMENANRNQGPTVG